MHTLLQSDAAHKGKQRNCRVALAKLKVLDLEHFLGSLVCGRSEAGETGKTRLDRDAVGVRKGLRRKAQANSRSGDEESRSAR